MEGKKSTVNICNTNEEAANLHWQVFESLPHLQYLQIFYNFDSFKNSES